MILRADSKYPNRRAYVLKLRSDATPGTLSGRLENVITGSQREFSSGDELLNSLTGDLQANAEDTSHK